MILNKKRMLPITGSINLLLVCIEPFQVRCILHLLDEVIALIVLNFQIAIGGLSAIDFQADITIVLDGHHYRVNN